ncbi:MAG: aldolase/citrate lyase family protein [Bacteroidota bacterium]
MNPQPPITTEQLAQILRNDGVLMIPAVTGYLLMGATAKGVEKIFEIKQRPEVKTIGLAATPAIYKALCRSHFRTAMCMIKYPMGVIDYANTEHPLFKKLPSLASKEGKIGCFFNAGKPIVELAEYCYEQDMLLMITSANPSGQSIVQKIAQAPQEMLDAVDHVIEDDAFIAKTQRSFEPPHSTILDLTTQQVLRVGLYANQIKHRAVQLGMLKDKGGPFVYDAFAKPPRSVMFLLSYKASSFDKIYHYAQADWFVLDLEDSCPPDKKEAGRANIQQFMQDEVSFDKPIFIRINSHRDEVAFEKDLALSYTTKITGFLLPMLRSPEDIHYIEKRLEEVEKRNQLPVGHFKLIPIVETAAAILEARAIAGASARICAFSWGHADLAADIHSVINENNKKFARTQVAWAAKSFGLPAIDAPCTDVEDYEGCRKEAHWGRAQGFDAKYVLHERHLAIVNEVFGISASEHQRLNTMVEDYYQNGEGMYVHPSGELLAPPFIKNMEHDLNRRISTTVQDTFHTLTATALQKQADVRFHVGQVLAPKNHMTIDEAWVSQWKSLSYNCQRIENDAVFTRKLGFKKHPIPYQAMIHYGIAQVVDCFSSYSKYHLGVLDGRQIRPAYSGDTFAVEMCITRMTPSSNGAYVIVESKINISNQHEELVLQMRRRSLFDAFEIPATIAPIPERFLEVPLSEEQLAIEQQILAVPSSENTLTADQLRNASLIRHDITSMLDLSQSSLYCHFFRNVHPLHLNHLRFDKVAMSGGVILPVVCGIVKAELGSVYWEELLQTAHLNPVRDGDLVGALSYIVRQAQIAEQTIELTLRTYGIRNLDVMNDLADLPIPEELFLHEGLKPSEMERMLHLCCPKLSRKLVLKVDWKVRVGLSS